MGGGEETIEIKRKLRIVITLFEIKNKCARCCTATTMIVLSSTYSFDARFGKNHKKKKEKHNNI